MSALDAAFRDAMHELEELRSFMADVAVWATEHPDFSETEELVHAIARVRRLELTIDEIRRGASLSAAESPPNGGGVVPPLAIA